MSPDEDDCSSVAVDIDVTVDVGIDTEALANTLIIDLNVPAVGITFFILPMREDFWDITIIYSFNIDIPNYSCVYKHNYTIQYNLFISVKS